MSVIHQSTIKKHIEQTNLTALKMGSLDNATLVKNFLPSPPFVNVEGVPNFRDLGGYLTTSIPAHSIRSQYLYRGGATSQVTEKGIQTLQKLRITHVYDLRSEDEIERAAAAGYNKMAEWEGSERISTAVFSHRDYSNDGIALRYKDYGGDGIKVSVLLQKHYISLT